MTTNKETYIYIILKRFQTMIHKAELNNCSIEEINWQIAHQWLKMVLTLLKMQNYFVVIYFVYYSLELSIVTYEFTIVAVSLLLPSSSSTYTDSETELIKAQNNSLVEYALDPFRKELIFKKICSGN